MIIIFEGENKKISEKDFTEMVLFFSSLLLTREEIDNLVLTISFEKSYAVKGWCGFCQKQDDNEYLIWIRPSRAKEMQIETLAHEIVHMKQNVRCEIDSDGLHTNKVIREWGGIEYEESAIEIEAHGRTHGMISRYNQSKNKN